MMTKEEMMAQLDADDTVYVDAMLNAMAEADALRAKLAAAEAEHDKLRSRLDIIMGYDMPELFVDWTENDADRYSEMSPPRMFNRMRELEAERDIIQKWVQKYQAQPDDDGLVRSLVGWLVEKYQRKEM